MNKANSSYKKEFEEYLAISNRSRLQIEFKVFRHNFISRIEQVLNDYGLVKRIELSRQQGQPVRVLDVGCGEGLFLHEMSNVFEEHNLLQNSELIGLDLDTMAINTAEAFARLAKPTRPELKFYIHDATQPLEGCKALAQTGPLSFDFIFTSLTMQILPNARQHIAELYKHLKPGGAIYLRDCILLEGPEGWEMPHPALEAFFRPYFTFLRSLNGVDFYKEQAGWLGEMGAERVQSISHRLPLGGRSEAGRQHMLNGVMIMNNFGPIIVQRGLITQAELTKWIAQVFSEITPDMVGHANYMDTLAVKPWA